MRSRRAYNISDNRHNNHINNEQFSGVTMGQEQQNDKKTISYNMVNSQPKI